MKITIIIVTVAFVTGFCLKGALDERAKLAIENKQLKQNEVVIQEDAKEAATNQVTLDRLDQMTKEMIDAVPEPDTSCLDGNDVDRLRNLWGEKSP